MTVDDRLAIVKAGEFMFMAFRAALFVFERLFYCFVESIELVIVLFLGSVRQARFRSRWTFAV